MSSSSTFHSNLSKTKSKDGNGRYIIQILERLTKVETQVSHLASKEDMANLRTDMADIRTDMADTRADMANRITSIYKALFLSIFTMVAIVGGAVIKVFFFP